MRWSRPGEPTRSGTGRPGPTTYFWAHQWSFGRGDVGYFGLQAHDLRDDGSVGKLAVFSIWAAVGCADNPTCHAGTEGAPFWTCRLAYEWVTGRAYRLRVANRRPGGWGATVSGLATGVETLVGSIQVPARWGGIGGFGTSTWTEFYGANVPGGLASCDLVPYSKVRFGVPAMDGGTVAPYGHRNRLGPGECANSAVADDPAGPSHAPPALVVTGPVGRCGPPDVLGAASPPSRGGFTCADPGRLHLRRPGTRTTPPRPGRGPRWRALRMGGRSEEHTSELQSRGHLVCRL